MDRRMALVVSLSVLIGGSAFSIHPASAQGSLRQQLVGVWTLVHNYNILPDEKRLEPSGPQGTGKGIFIADASGRFSWTLIRADLPKFASNNRQSGTDAENKAVAQGALAYFGTYEIDEDSKALTMHIEYSSYPNFNGATQRRNIKLENDELTIINSAGASGGTAYVIWKRVK
jgi:Lipocalin-like domain